MRIALLGSAPSSVDIAPFKDKSFQDYSGGKVQLQPMTPHIEQEWFIWACSPGCYGRIPRCDIYFELHRWEPGQPWFSPEYVQFLRDFKGPVYTGGPVPEIPNHRIYPIEDIERQFSSYFLTSSLSLMFALAIQECQKMDQLMEASGFAKEQHTIGLWGVDMAAKEEYGYQRAGCQHFILKALELGIEVYIPPESDLLRPMPVYGLCEWDHNWIKSLARKRELEAHLHNHQVGKYNAELSEQFMRGALENQQYYMDTWTSQYGLPAGQYLKKSDDKAAAALNVVKE